MTIRSFALTVLILAVVAGSVEAGTYVNSVQSDNPVGYWRLEEGSGTAVDSSSVSGFQNGAYVGSVGTITGAIASESQNVAADFTGTTGLVRISDPSGLLGTALTSNSWTIEFWMSLSSAGGHQNPVTKGLYPAPGATFFNREASRFTFGINNGSGGLATTSLPALNTWTHIVGVLEADGSDTRASLYSDGSLVSSTTITGQPSTSISTTPLFIGTLAWSSGGYLNQFNGAVDEVAVYNYALGADRVKAHFDAATAIVPLPSAAVAGLALLSVLAVIRRRRTP